MDNDKSFYEFIKNPQVGTRNKKRAFINIFKNKIDEDLLSFLLILIEKERILHLREKVNEMEKIILEKNNTLIKQVIERELARDGQVFYLYNRTDQIANVAYKISSTVPNAKVAIGHGQMDKNELEDVMLRFMNKEFNVLICTTIIETGIDIPNANTMIVEDADKFGLAQLYQIRGRVGRSERGAYAYLLYKKDKPY